MAIARRPAVTEPGRETLFHPFTQDHHELPNEKTSTPKHDPSHAPEAGEPDVSGRSRGHIVDEKNPAGPQAGKKGEMQSDRESGRQDAMS